MSSKILSLFAKIIRALLCAVTGKARLRKIYLDEASLLLEPEDRYLIPSLDKGHIPESGRFYYQKNHVEFNIKEGDKVLDIGSGAYPFPHATHLADLYEGETTHRTEDLNTYGKPFKACNIECLPYEDKEFDFVYCSHVLEHVDDPAKACEEIIRVGKRGYIETPTRTSDIMLNFTRLKEHHKWYINMAGNTLFFFEWPDKDRKDTGYNDFFKMLHSKYGNSFQSLANDNMDFFVNMLIWDKVFFYYIFDKEGFLTKTNRGF